ncbi:MAG: YybS family protein [Spirochaetales bacterium]|jgi:hypothetical protein|nr:YybS family protein [Spirochaetales bacterium]
MAATKKHAAALEIAVLAAASVIFFKLSVFLLVFVIPLALLYRRRGFYGGLCGSCAAAAGILGLRLYEAASLGGGVNAGLLLVEFTIPGAFLVGLAVLEAPRFSRFPSWKRLLGATFAALLVSLHLVYFIATSAEYEALLKAQVEATLRYITEAQGEQGTLAFVSVEEITRLSRLVFLDTYLAGYFVTLAANWVIGVRMAMRMGGEMREFPAYRSFRMPDGAVWIFLLSWAVVFISRFRSLGFGEIAAWNTALLVSILYACQGVGIIKSWTYDMAPVGRFAVTVMLFTLLFVPGLRFIVIAGVPLLGVTELWIHYRNKIRS